MLILPPKNIGTFLSYMDFRVVKDVIENIAFTEKSTYSKDGDIYKISTTTIRR